MGLLRSLADKFDPPTPPNTDWLPIVMPILVTAGTHAARLAEDLLRARQDRSTYIDTALRGIAQGNEKLGTLVLSLNDRLERIEHANDDDEAAAAEAVREAEENATFEGEQRAIRRRGDAHDCAMTALENWSVLFPNPTGTPTKLDPADVARFGVAYADALEEALHPLPRCSRSPCGASGASCGA
jgi:hypothetical protein